MSTARIHLMRRNRKENRPLQLAAAPVSNPIDIFRRVPAMATTPALFELIDLTPSPILLIEETSTEEFPAIAAARPALAMAA